MFIENSTAATAKHPQRIIIPDVCAQLDGCLCLLRLNSPVAAAAARGAAAAVSEALRPEPPIVLSRKITRGISVVRHNQSHVAQKAYQLVGI